MCDELQIFLKEPALVSGWPEHAPILTSVELSDDPFRLGEPRFHNAELCVRCRLPCPAQLALPKELLGVISQCITLKNCTAKL
jgi:hypothetical protein